MQLNVYLMTDPIVGTMLTIYSLLEEMLCSMKIHLCFSLCVLLQECCMAVPLSQIIFIEEQAAGIGKR